jgi:multimeric flavodoxin WrbA/protein-tyrosine-phosphatase
MHILGLQGSPRKKSNTHDLLSMFMEQTKKYGAATDVINVHKQNIVPCKELIVCEKKGFCPIKDDMDDFIYARIKNADIVVLAAPVFFYNVPAQIKALIDRCQMFWGRKYKLKLKDPNSNLRKGFLLSCGASGGKKLFEGSKLTAKIFFDALSVKYEGSLTYMHIEDPGQMVSHPTVKQDVKKAVKNLCVPFLSKKRILFVSKNDALRTQIAAAFFKLYDKGRFNVLTAGVDALEEIYPETVKVMAEKQLDLIYFSPVSLDHLDRNYKYDHVVYFGKDSSKVDIKAFKSEIWEIDLPKEMSQQSIKELRDNIAIRVKELISSLVP